MKKFTRLNLLIVIFLLSVFSVNQSKGGGVIEIGTSIYDIQQVVPCYGYYGYSWSEVVYLQSEIGNPCMITKIAYKHYDYFGEGPYYMGDESIYMKLVPYGVIPNQSYPDPVNNGYSLVYQGAISWQGSYEWNVITLDVPFIYDGTNNLSIVYEDHDPDWGFSYPYWFVTWTDYISCKYQYADSDFPAYDGWYDFFRPNVQLYWEDAPGGTLTGTVTDASTGFPIIGAKVTVGSDYVYTFADGVYSFELVQGTYDVIFEKPGYVTQIQNVFIAPGTTTLNVALVEDAVPPSGVLAALRPPANNVVDITWGIPNGFYEIIYDDGTFENMTAWLLEGSVNALKFTPVAYPVTITGGSVNIGDGTYPPDGDQLQTFNIAVFDDDGAGGYPGTLLGGIEVTPTAFGWVPFDLSSLGITLTSGDFYIGLQQGGDWPNCAPIAVDETNPVYRSYSKYDGAPWTPAGYNDFMIRAICQGPGGGGGVMAPGEASYVEYTRPAENTMSLYPPRISSGYVGEGLYVPRDGGESPRNLDHYSIYRLHEFEEGHPDQWTLLAGFIAPDVHSYTDNAWSTLDDGGYCWAVVAHYTGVTSDAALSNLLGKNWLSEVTINVTTSGGESAQGAQVLLKNNDGLPEHQYSALVPASGTVVFPAVWKGMYDLTAVLFNYYMYQQLDFGIYDNTTVIDVVLQEKTNPPSGLYVDPLTLLATWQAPAVDWNLLTEGWNSYDFYTNGWTFDPYQPSNWYIYSYMGNPAPSAWFYYYPTQTDYSFALVSKSIEAAGMPHVWLTYDLFFSNYSTSTVENLGVELWDGSQWLVIKNFSSADYPGGFSWTSFTHDISQYVQTVPDFKIRFRAWGANSFNINYWIPDNIHIYGSQSGDNRAVMGYNVYLDDAQAGFTTDTQFQYPGSVINWGQTYVSSVEAVYASGFSNRIYYTWTSIYLPPPTGLTGEDVGHAAYLTWLSPGGSGGEIFEHFLGAGIPSAFVVSDGRWSCPGNSYMVMSGTGNAWASAYYGVGAEPWTDGTFEVMLRKTSGSYDYSMGAFIRANGFMNSGYQNGYLFNITQSGYHSIWKEQYPNEIMLVGWTVSGYVNTGGDNVLTFICAGPVIQFYINGNLIYTLNDASFPSGVFNMSVYDDSYGSQVNYDYYYWAALATDAPAINPQEIVNADFGPTVGGTSSQCFGPAVNTPPVEPKSMIDNSGRGEYGPLIAYHIYRDGMHVGQTDAETYEYTDQPLSAGWYSYTITAEYGSPTPGESMHEGPVDVYINGEGNITGTVTRYGSQPIPISGAIVTAFNEFDTFTATTGTSGHYTLNGVTEGTYSMTCEADGYVTETRENVYVPFDQTVTEDFNLKEFPYPVLSVSAVRNYERTEVAVNWYEYNNFYQIIYDDGIADNLTAWDKAGNMNAIRFTPAGYPAQIFGLQVNIGDGTWPPGDILTPFQMALYDDDGEVGMPGTQLAIVDVTPYSYGWVYADFSLAGVTVESGDFYGVMIQGGDFPDCAPIAIDETNPVFRSYSQYISGNEPWRPSSLADFMMRAFVYSEVDGSQILNYTDKIDISTQGVQPISMKPANVKEGQYDVGFGRFVPRGENKDNDTRAFDHYRVYVLPQGQENNQEAWTLKADNLTVTDYTDTDWTTYDKGWYRYAVISVYTYNESAPAFSNPVPKDFDWDVTINVRTDDNMPATGAQITFFNENGNSQYLYTGVADENGVVFLHNVWEGYYTLEAFLDYYQPYQLQHIPVYNNITINITLHDACLPPQQFHVNSQTGVATWLPPVLDYYTVFEEGFEGGVIPPGWTQEYVSEAVPWTVQTGNPSGSPNFAHTGEYNAAFYGTTAATRLITPEIDLGGELLPKLIFYHTQPGGSGQDELKIYYRVSPTTVWKPLTSYIENIPVWTKAELNLPNPTAHYQIGFMSDTPSPPGNGICVDDVKVIAGINPLGGDGGEARVLEGYNVYLNGVHMAFTTELTYTYTDLVIGQFYVAGVDAQYTTCHSIIVEYPFTYYTCDYFNQPTNFVGVVNGMNVLLTWGPPEGIEYVEYQVKYDDGIPENAMAWYSAGGMTAVRFTPGGYPAEIRKFHMQIWDGTWPAGDILTSFKIHIYDDDGGNGYPGTDLGSIEVTPDHYLWIEFDITSLGVAIGSGDFYLAHEQLHDYPNCPPTGIDESSAGQGRSYDHAVGVGWGPGQYDQYMIRATVYGPYFGDQILEPVTVPAGGITDGTAVSVNVPAAPAVSGEVTLGSGEFVYPDGRTRFALKGYNVYKDGKTLNDLPLTMTTYLDVCSPGGIYYYNVTAVYDMGESCPLDPPFEAIVGADFPPPSGLTAEVLEGDDVLLTWNQPGTATGEWIHWDDGENFDAIGLTSGGDFMVASRWAVEDLVPYDGMFLTKITFFPRGATSDYALKVWTGENAGTLVLSQPLGSVIIEQWNTVTLTTPVPIDATQELWFGYSITGQPAGEYPAGCDAGPAVAGKGDMISTDGATWDPLSGFGLDYNWNLQGWVIAEGVYAPLASIPQVKLNNSGDVYPAAGMLKPVNASSFVDNDRLTLLGYNLWRNGSNIHFEPAPDTFYIDPMVAPGTYAYYVSAKYDAGESFADGPAVVTITPKGSLTGLVYDGMTNSPIVGAVVTTDPGGYTATTIYNGHYTISGIPVGTYSATATAAGYVPKTKFGIEVVYNEATTADFAMYDNSVMTLPFFEPWDSGSFETNYWTFDPSIGNWQINVAFGNPAPAAEFIWTPTVTQYSYALVSPDIDASTAIENVTLAFDLYLSDYGATGVEKMRVDVWDGATWTTIDEFVNTSSIDWVSKSYNITDIALGKLIKVRFVANGEDSYQINNWDIDNIKVYEQILATLQGTVTQLATGDPVQNAKITVEGYAPVFTNAQGYYTVNVEEGTYNVTAEKEGYCTVEDNIFITGVTDWNVELGQPTMSVDPTQLNEQLVQGQSSTQYLTIFNDGNCPLHWNAAIALLDKTATPDMQLQTSIRTNSEQMNPSQDYSPRVTTISGNETDDVWDLQFNYDFTSASGGVMGMAGIEFDGLKFYCSIWSAGDILTFDRDGNFLASTTIGGASQIRDLAWDGTYLYGGSAANTIYQIDPATMTVVGSFASPEAVRAIAYDPIYDAFWIANWDTDIYLVARDGSMIDVIPNPGLGSMYGLAYDNVTGPPSLWIFDQGGSGAVLIQLDITSGTLTGVTHDVLPDVPVTNAIAGGAFLTTAFIPGTVTLGGLIQGDWDAGFGYEIGTVSLWLMLQANQGDVQPGISNELAVYFNAEGLEPGGYDATITFSSTPDVGTINVPVHLDVQVGIDEPFGEGQISIYPNPAADYVNVVVTDKVTEIRVLNYVGQVVYEMNVVKDKTFRINTSAFSSGSYMIEFTGSDGMITTRSVVITR